LPVFELT